MPLLVTRTGHVLAHTVEFARTRAARRRGALGRSHMDPSTALVLVPCCAVHTAFMRFSIDVIFLDPSDTVIQIVDDLAPWHVAVSPFAKTTIELAAGTVRWCDVKVGDHLSLPLRGAEAEEQAAAARELLPAYGEELIGLK